MQHIVGKIVKKKIFNFPPKTILFLILCISCLEFPSSQILEAHSLEELTHEKWQPFAYRLCLLLSSYLSQALSQVQTSAGSVVNRALSLF